MNIPESVGSTHTEKALRVLILGGGEISREMAVAFQQLGIEVHCAHKRRDAPGMHGADAAHTLDVSEGRGVVDLVRHVRPAYVLTEDALVDTDALRYIAKEGLATVMPGPEAIHLAVDRERIRDVATRELGLPAPAYLAAETFTEFEVAVGQMGYPCVVKPNRGVPARGFSILRSEEDILPAWESAHQTGLDEAGRVIVEQYVKLDGEITVLAIRSIDPATGKPATWFCEPIGCDINHGDLRESWQPVAMSEQAYGSARSIAARIVNRLCGDEGRGLFGVELFVDDDDIYFSGVTTQPHDTGFVTVATQRFSQFELHARAILGLPIDATLTSPGACRVLHAENHTRLVSFEGLTEALTVPESDVRIFGKASAYPGRRMGLALATAETTDAAREAAGKTAGAIKIVEA